MSLSEEERNALVTLQMEKARTFLQQADEMYVLKYWDIASNRYYYACFHAVQALLIKHGLTCRTHDGLIGCFGLNFINRNNQFTPGKFSVTHRTTEAERGL